MLLTQEQEKQWVDKIIQKSQDLLTQKGSEECDQVTGLIHRECRLGHFVLIEHQRQTLSGGKINSNGLDIWIIEGGTAKKALCVSYMPYEIRHFNKAGQGQWIKELMAF